MSEMQPPPAATEGGGGNVLGLGPERRTDTATAAPSQAGLRPYQADLIARVMAAISAGTRRILIVAPTGSGKTVIAAALVHAMGRPRTLFLAHRWELIDQASGKLHAAGIDHGIIQAGFPARMAERVQVASVPTLHRRAIASDRMEMPPAALVLVDEAHHVTARTYRQIIEACPNATIIGLTATPCRGDGRGLGGEFNVLIEAPQVPELIASGFLVGTRLYAPTVPDLRGVHTRAGDYIGSELAERVDKPELVGDVVEHWLRLAGRKPTIVFAVNVAHSQNLRDAFRRSGVLAEHLDGSTPADERRAILAKLKSGVVDVVTNCAVLTEGFDAPDVGCIVLARPTRSLGLFRQMVGRGLRPAPGKSEALIIDHSGAVHVHGRPEDEILWTLLPDRRAANKSQRARNAGTMPALATCPECKAIRQQGAPCGSCGWRPQPKRRDDGVTMRDGVLGLMQRDRSVKPEDWTPEQRARFHRELLGYTRRRGKKDGYAAHLYKERFGAWPPRGPVQPVAPSDATLRWIRSRIVRFVRGRRAVEVTREAQP